MDGSGDKITVIDGSFASELANYVDEDIDGHPLWSARFLATNPEAVVQTHLDYLRAGAEVIETNTYQANVENFRKHLDVSEREAYDLIKSAVDLAKEAVKRFHLEAGDRKVSIAGSVGPYGVSLHDGSEYSGSYIESIPLETIREWHRPRVRALIEAGVDFLALETQPCLKEAALLVELLKEFPGTKAWLSFSCDEEVLKTAHGDDFQKAAEHCYNLNPEQIIAVGVNCLRPSRVEKLLGTMKNKQIPLIAYPNSGEKYDKHIGSWKDDREDIERYVPMWLDLGVKYVGGCCRVKADGISAIKGAVELWGKTKKNRNLSIK